MSHTLFPSRAGKLQAQCDTVSYFKQSLMEMEGEDAQRSQAPHRPRCPLSSFGLSKTERPGTKCKEKPEVTRKEVRKKVRVGRQPRELVTEKVSTLGEQSIMPLGTLESSGVGGTQAREEETGSFRYWLLADI